MSLSVAGQLAMADDIDIEEHDVLENPVIRNIFPDISVIKKEISQYYEDVPIIKQEQEIITNKDKLLKDQVVSTNANADVTSRQVHEPTSSKNHASKLTIDKPESEHNKLKKPFQGTKIILGSKPNKAADQTQDGEVDVNKKQNISLESVVRIPELLLQDLGEYIYQSNRYCDDCRTLFPSKSDLDNHKLKFHYVRPQHKRKIVKVSLKSTPMDKRNKCDICGSCFCRRFNLIRHYKNVHKKVMTNNYNSIKNASCITPINNTKRTLNKFVLISRKSNENAIRTRNKHLSVKMTLRETESDKKANTSQNKNQIEKTVSKPVNNKQTKQNTSINRSKCRICGSYFSNIGNLNRHYKNIHKKKVSSKLKYKILSNANNRSRVVSTNKAKPSREKNAKPTAKNVCFHCNKQFFDQKCLIEHIYKILGPKKCLKQKRNKILALLKEKHTNSTIKINTEPSNTKTEGIRMKDKLIFENEDSDGSESPSPETDNNKNVDFGSKITLKENNTVTTTQEKEQIECVTDDTTLEKEQDECLTDDESRSLDQPSPKPLRNKRKHDLSDDDDAISLEWNFLDTDGTDENQPSQSHSMNKKRKLETASVNSSKATSKSSNTNAKLDTSNKHITLKKKTKPINKLRTINKNEIGRVGLRPKNGNNNKLKGSYVYECIYCSFILPTSRSYCMHMFWRHKLDNVTRVNKVIFDIQCKYCPYRASKKNHNRHLRVCHYDLLTKPHYEADDYLQQKEAMELKNPEFKKVKSFVLKSIVYKCKKCDIHFLSSCIAKDHEKHMELLINWKCSICKKIYKKHDKHLHLKQHKFSKTVNVCQFDESELSRLLYNCTKCAIHFTEERYLEHYPKCGNESTDSVYCKKCDILIDKCEYATHETYHKTGNNTEDLIVITGDIITKNQEDSRGQEKTSSQENEEIETDKNGPVIIYSPMNCLTFCQTCKCYLSDIAINRKSHVEARCSKMVKYTCPTCGLVLTNKTINTHRDHHKKKKGLKLQDFEFFDLNGIQIRPPIPDYPSCRNCEVIFVGRNAVKNHICSETEYLTCEICNVKLSENAFKLHMNFHSYCMRNEKVDQVVSRQSLQIEIGLEKHGKVLNASLCAAMPKTDKLQAVEQTECRELNVKMDKHTAIPISQTVEATKSPPKKQNLSTVIESNHKGVTENNARSNIILYTCQSCKISVDTYDKVIEHCQNHFCPNPMIPLSLKICSKCSLKFEIDTYDLHQKLNLCCDLKQVLTFDPVYFTSDNNIWTQHIFASATPSIQKEAIQKSMYQHECRIKIDVVQQGPSNLTVHKCNRCSIFTDPDSLISHIRDGCYRTPGKHPCSVCGLPFTSSVARANHEKIHRQHDDVRLKSYNILLINSETHSSYNISILNAMKQYVLYQCRTCDAIVDKLQRNNHKCNVDDLLKCTKCSLILYKDDFERHISYHSDLALYNTANMKVILFGHKDEPISNKTLFSSFTGVVCDYKLYKCNKCEDCENDEKLTSRHVCTFDDSKWKCPKCGIYISARSIKQHIKMHDVNAEFMTENFMFINFDITEGKDKNPNKTKKIHGPDGTKEIHCIDNGSSNKRKSDAKADQAGVTESEKDRAKLDLDHNAANIKENSANNNQESVPLYKCICGLHYLDEMTAKNHSKHCSPKMKVIKQNCSKCSLTFNPKELFSHILAHHGDKNKLFKYHVIEIKGN